MPRRNPLLFKTEEYQFLHRVYLNQESRAKLFVRIKQKRGVGLDQEEIDFVKKKFQEWQEANQNELLWMNKK